MYWDVGSVSMAFIVLYGLGTLILKTGDLSWIVFFWCIAYVLFKRRYFHLHVQAMAAR